MLKLLLLTFVYFQLLSQLLTRAPGNIITHSYSSSPIVSRVCVCRRRMAGERSCWARASLLSAVSSGQYLLGLGACHRSPSQEISPAPTSTIHTIQENFQLCLSLFLTSFIKVHSSVNSIIQKNIYMGEKNKSLTCSAGWTLHRHARCEQVCIRWGWELEELSITSLGTEWASALLAALSGSQRASEDWALLSRSGRRSPLHPGSCTGWRCLRANSRHSWSILYSDCQGCMLFFRRWCIVCTQSIQDVWHSYLLPAHTPEP